MIAQRKQRQEREFPMPPRKIKKLEVEDCIKILTRGAGSELITKKLKALLSGELVKLKRARNKNLPNDASQCCKQIMSMLLELKEEHGFTFDHPTMDHCEQYTDPDLPLRFEKEAEFRILMYAAYHLAAILR